MSEQKEQRCEKPGCGAQRIVSKPCRDWDCPQQTVHHSDHRAALEAQAAENAELRALYEAAVDLGENNYAKACARALAAETALATAREDAKGREGWKLVPIEPTERMIEMARTCIKRLPEDQRARLLFEDWRTTHGIKMRARWAAMLAASPLSQGGQADG